MTTFTEVDEFLFPSRVADALLCDERRIAFPPRPALASTRVGTVAGMTPTEEQWAILETAVQVGLKCLVIGAGAGCGKTAVLKQLEQRLPGRGQYTAFNSSLVAESKAKFVKCAVNTTHSLAFRAIGRKFAHRLNGPRVRGDQIARQLGIKDMRIETGVDDHGKPTFKNLAAGFLASRVMLAIRKFCQIADTDLGPEHFRYIDGIDMPGTDGKRGRANNARVAEYLLPFAQGAWFDLSDPNGTLPYFHACYFKKWQLGVGKNRPVIEADYILIDECFPAGTLVETDAGPVAIEEITKHSGQWRVLTSQDGGKTLHYSSVTSAYRTLRTGPLVRIEHERGEICCTANHPLWVEGRGWVAAGLVACGDALSCLRETDAETAKDLFSIVRHEVESCEPLSGRGSGSQREDFQADESGSHRDSQSDGAVRGSRQSVGNAQIAGNHLLATRGQRSRSNGVRVATLPGTGPSAAELAMESRTCCLQWTTKEGRLPHPLQNRHSVSSEDGCRGSGRVESSLGSGANKRCEEDRSADLSRVVGVTVCEPGCQRESNLGGSDDHQYVYTLSVESGAYFADSVLAKNCQDSAPVFLDVIRQQSHALVILVGDDNQQIYEFLGATNAMTAFPGAPRCLLSQSFRFGQTIADVANSILAGLEVPTDLVMKGLPSIPSRIAPVADPRCILTRTNAGAVGTVLRAFADGKRPHLIGGGDEVVSFVKAAQDLQDDKPTSHPELCCFESWKEVQAYSKTDEGEDLALMVKLIDGFGCDKILAALEKMPSEEKADLIVSTAHKSKGREWDTVRLAGDFPPANRMDDSDRRLLYVAATRAKVILDLSVCTPFLEGLTDPQTETEVEPIRIVYTVPMPTEEQTTAYLSGAALAPVQAPATATPETPVLVVTATPAPTAPAAEFTWANHNGAWVVRGPKGKSGAVKVTKKNGTTSITTLGTVVREFADGNCLYAV